LSAGERACFRDGLRHHLVTRYAGLLRLYDEQAVSYASSPGSDGRGTVVQTIAVAEGPPLVIGYRMQAAGEVWRVVDFTVDGESLVEGYRDQYRYEIGRIGLGDFLRSFEACRER
jgi:ABC-type transporter MlaC component